MHGEILFFCLSFAPLSIFLIFCLKSIVLLKFKNENLAFVFYLCGLKFKNKKKSRE